MFQKVRAAYEALADERARLRTLIFHPSQGESLEDWIEELRCQTTSQRLGLEQIRALFHRV